MARLDAGARKVLGRELTAGERRAFRSYVSLLQAWQRTYRLVGSAEPEWIVDELLLDSLLFTCFLPAPCLTAVDLGSGAGIPGIPLKIVLTGLRLTLLEARRRRASFLATVIRELGFEDVTLLACRAEDALRNDPSLGHGFQVVVSRCAGDLNDVVVLAERFVSPGGRIVVSGPPAPLGGEATNCWRAVDHPTKNRPRRFFVREARNRGRTGS